MNVLIFSAVGIFSFLTTTQSTCANDSTDDLADVRPAPPMEAFDGPKLDWESRQVFDETPQFGIRESGESWLRGNGWNPSKASEPIESSPMGLDQQHERRHGMTAEKLRDLMRPTLKLHAEWQGESNDIEFASYAARLDFPTYPFFGPPPPFINLGFSYSNLQAPRSLDLPSDLYETSLGLSWMRKLNDRWLLRFMAATANATDGENNSSQAWQFRGGAFAIYKRSDQWTWIFGAIALGRNDIPVLPAVGAIYQPRPQVRWELTMPKPRFAFLLQDKGPRQQWGYVGLGLGGGTWAYQRRNGQNDQLTYGNWRFVVGWESIPTPEKGMPFTRGRKLSAEIGYVFDRDFEFESPVSTIRLSDVWMLRTSMTF